MTRYKMLVNYWKNNKGSFEFEDNVPLKINGEKFIKIVSGESLRNGKAKIVVEYDSD